MAGRDGCDRPARDGAEHTGDDLGYFGRHCGEGRGVAVELGLLEQPEIREPG